MRNIIIVLRKSGRILAWTLLGLILLVLILHLGFARKAVLGYMTGYARRNLGLTVEASSLGYNLPALRLRLKDVTLGRADRPNLPSFFTADEILVKLTPEIILKGRINLKNLEISNPRVNLVFSDDGASNLPSGNRPDPGEPPPSSEFPPEFIIERGLVRNAGISYSNKSSGLTAELAGLDIELFWKGGGIHSLSLRTYGKGKIEYQTSSFPLKTLLLEADLGRDGSFVRDFRLDLDGLTLAFAGRMNNYAAPVLDMTLTGAVSLAALKEMIGMREEISGQVEVESRIQGPISAVEAEGTILVDNLNINPLEGAGLRTGFSWKDGALTFPDLSLTALGGELKAAGLLHPTDWNAGNNLTLSWNSLDPAPILRRFDLSLPLSTRLSGTAELSWAGPIPDTLEGRAEAAFTSVTVSAGTGNSVGLSGRILAESRKGRTDLTIQNVSLPGIIVNGKIRLDGGRFGGDYEADIENAGNLKPLLNAISGARQSTEFPTDDITGRFNLSGRLAGTMAAPLFTADVKGSGISALGFEDVSLESRLAYEPGFFRLESLALISGGGRLDAKGAYRSGSSAALDFELTGAKFPAASILRPGALAGVRPGFIDIGFRVGGSPDRPAFELNGLLSGFTLGEEELPRIRVVAKSEGADAQFSIEAEALASRATGSVRMEAPYPARIRVDFDGSPLDKIIRLVYDGLPKETTSGILEAGIEAEGELARLGETLELAAAVADLRLKSGSLDIAADGPFTLSYGKSGLAVDGLNIRGGGTDLRVQGALPSAGESETGIELRGAADLGELAGLFAGTEGQGVLSFEASVYGSIREPRIRSILETMAARWKFSAMPDGFEDIRVSIAVADETIEIGTFFLLWRTGQFGLRGEIPFESLPFSLPFAVRRGGRAAALSLSVENLDPSLLNAFIPADALGEFSGQMDAEIQAGGSRLTLESLSADARFPEFRFDLNGIPLLRRLPYSFRLREGILSPDKSAFEGDPIPLDVSGSLDLLNGTADLRIEGVFGLESLRAFSPEMVLSGDAAVSVRASGNIAQPAISGFLDLRDAGVEATVPPLGLRKISGRLGFDGNRISLTDVQGELNGGSVLFEGGITHRAAALESMDIRMSGEGVFLAYPAGLFSESALDLRLSSDGTRHSLAGTISLTSAEYVEDVDVKSELVGFLKRKGSLDPASEPLEFFEAMDLDIKLETPGFLVADNNLVQANLSADLRLSGTLYQPGLRGRILVEEGGKVIFSGTTYEIERGEVVFANPVRIEPNINVNARTEVNGYKIQLTLSGSLEDFSARLVSDPSLSEPDIISLLLTGKPLAYTSETGMKFMSDRALTYLNSTLTGGIGNFAKETFGLTNVILDASLLAPQESPEARISVGQQITPQLMVIVSQNLKEAQDRTVIADYSPYRDLNLRGVKKESDDYQFDVRHVVRFGPGVAQSGPSVLARRKGPLVRSVSFEGNPGLPENVLLRRLKLTPGKGYKPKALRRDVNRLRRLYEKNGYLGFRLMPQRLEKEGGIGILYRVDSGPVIDIRYLGTQVPGKVRKAVRQSWRGGMFQGLAVNNAATLLERHFRSRGYYQVKVEPSAGSGNGGPFVVFRISPGSRYENLEVGFEGNRAFSASSLRSHFKSNQFDRLIFEDSGRVARGMEEFFKNRGYIRARVQPSALKFVPAERKAVIDLAIDEGPLFRLHSLSFEGRGSLSEEELNKAVAVRPGTAYSPVVSDAAVDAVKSAYARKGFKDAEIVARTRVDEEKALVDLLLEIDEKTREVVRAVEISGNVLTKDRTVRRRLAIKPGAPLDRFSLHKSQKNLYDLQIFGQVDFTLTPRDEGEGEAKTKKYYDVEFAVTELKPYLLRYGIQYDTDAGLGISGEITNRNFLGRALLIGASFNLSRMDQGIRVFLRSRYLLGLKASTDVFAFLNRQEKPGFKLERGGFTLQQQARLGRSWLLTYNYSLERTLVYETEPDIEAPDKPVNVGRMTAAVSRDTRDDVMNPTKGIFFSQTVAYASPALGSDLNLLRSFGQLFALKRIARNTYFAIGIRVGLGSGFGQPLPLSERFFAGGGSSVRGFGLDEVGPKSPDSQVPVGGDALLILNQEIRYPIYHRLSGVVFLDIGNVYESLSDFKLFSTREAAGVGLRWNSPFAMLRLDWGFKLDRRPGESGSVIHFSIGQAF